jgi:hypothetical protein
VIALPFLMDRDPDRPFPRRVLILSAAGGIAAAVLVIGYQLQPLQYLMSLRMQLAHASSGHGAFLFGKTSEQGWWYYHLAAMVVKTPIPLLALVLAAVAGGAHRRLSRQELIALAVPPAALIVMFCLIPGPNIGIRYILPVYPFLIVIAGGAAALAWERRPLRVVVVLLLAWQIGGTLRIFPDYLAYFNEAVGGPSRGHEYLVDSNLDWGQDLKQLKSYVDAHDLGRIRLSYFGAADPKMYEIDYSPLPGYYLGSGLGPPMKWRGTFVVSATNLAGIYLDRDFYARFREREPDAVIGHSMFVFELDDEDAE